MASEPDVFTVAAAPAELPPIAEGEIPFLEVLGARVHNLKNINVRIPRNRVVVITGISGSGKSSLAFDTIYAEGQRRYMESMSSYARQFVGSFERPDVDDIRGLSPVVAIEQKTVSKNPRSTVGTITEVYDFLRLLFARCADAYSHLSGQKMVQYTEEQMADIIRQQMAGQRILLLAPLVRGRKGHYRELFETYRRQGYLKVRVDGELRDLKEKMQVDRYSIHDIELVVDRLDVTAASAERLDRSIRLALRLGKGMLMVINEQNQILHFSRTLIDPLTGISYEMPSPNTFSFNSPYGACPRCKGLGFTHEVRKEDIIPDPNKSINEGGIAPLGLSRDNFVFQQLRAIAARYRFTLAKPIKEIPKEALNLILYGSTDEKVALELQFDEHLPQEYSTTFEGVVPMLYRWYRDSESERLRRWAESFMTEVVCPECQGSRLKKESLSFRIAGKNIYDLAQMSIRTLVHWFDMLPDQLSERQRLIGQEVIKELKARLRFLCDVGLDYLTLNRPARSLSGGESQRIRLATQMGSQLVGITYILDEPSIGLHQRDNRRLIHALHQLSRTGNTIIVVEHDKDIMLSADYVIDLGPGAGEHGGYVVSEGPPHSDNGTHSLTVEYLKGQREIRVPSSRRKGQGRKLKLRGCRGNNLKNITVSFPLGCLIGITGVSGSGKSSLITETLYPILSNHFYGSRYKPLPYESIEGLEFIDKVIEIDQSPIGRTPRSNPATYINVFTEIRQLFSQLPESRMRGYAPGRFSFNVKGGRCEACQGGGMRLIEMSFLPDVYVICEKCLGRRYNRETLEIRYRGKNISEILDMTVAEAVTFFEPYPSICRKLRTLQEVGLGYLRLGQQATTLSGGEAQRVKLSAELARRDTGRTFYILDEPTTGLHFEDIRLLMEVLNRLVDKGNTVVIIEHNLDVIKLADYIIDLGPEGGDEGGYVVAEGTPEAIVAAGIGYTAQFLARELAAA
ncbi:MAG: excinuclease ABC subunit UvrA [Chitinophagales bacterium]|nr:excinuclease ABC subunit UvrA [Chitinophagales bacterium]MDW8428070.1 excinuclease ABC subunit UvrA [Chitinophagales bacterium]